MSIFIIFELFLVLKKVGLVGMETYTAPAMELTQQHWALLYSTMAWAVVHAFSSFVLTTRNHASAGPSSSPPPISALREGGANPPTTTSTCHSRFSLKSRNIEPASCPLSIEGDLIIRAKMKEY